MSDLVEFLRALAETFREWLADVWWTLRSWLWIAYGAADRWWWRVGRKLFGPGPQSTLTVADSLPWPRGQKVAIDPGTSRCDVVRVVRADGYTIVVEAAQSWRWRELGDFVHARLGARWRP